MDVEGCEEAGKAVLLKNCCSALPEDPELEGVPGEPPIPEKLQLGLSLSEESTVSGLKG